MAATITLQAPFDMASFDFSDVFNGTITSSSATEVDYTGAGGVNHYVFQGTEFGAISDNVPSSGTISSFTIDGVLAWTGVENTFGALRELGFTDNVNNITETGSSGNDTLVAGNFSTVMGGDGNDTIDIMGLGTLVMGGRGDDVLNGFHRDGDDAQETTASYADATSGVKVYLSLTTSQNVGGGLGHDTLNTIDDLIGSKFSDHLIGGTTDNTLDGHGGLDTLGGGQGNDTLIAYDTADTINGGPGFDLLEFKSTTGLTIDMNDYKGIESLITTSQNDTVTGTAQAETFNLGDGDDVLHAGGGGDTILASAGNDLIDGGTGSDTIDFSRSKAQGITVDLSNASPQAVGAGYGTDTLVSVESVKGTLFADTITGSSANNTLYGGEGNDIISGGGGNDTIEGFYGQDTLTGGAGADTFVYNDNISAGVLSSTRTYDTITDFDASQDHLALGGVSALRAAGGDFNSADFADEVQNAFGKMDPHTAIFLTVTSGDLAGQSFLLVNQHDVSASAFSALCIHFGADSNLAGFGTQDFI